MWLMTTRPINSKPDWEALPAGTTASGILTGTDRRAKVTVTRGPDEDPIARTTWDQLWSRLLDITVEERALTITDKSGTAARTISTEDSWDSLPVGTLARVHYDNHDDDGAETHGGTMSILRVDGDVRANAGDCMLAGGKYWTEVWVWQQGVVVFNPTALPEPDFEDQYLPPLASTVAAVEAAIADHAWRVKEIVSVPDDEYVKIPREARPDRTPALAIIEALQARGWAPAPVHPEGVQVWTISGIPDGGRSDGTQAYLSLPAGDPDKQLRSDIWLDQPIVSVNFELPARTVNY
jgi:hypothetical protein